MGGGSSGGGGNNTVTQVQQLPQFQQDQAQANENTANAIAAQPYTPYQGQTVAGFSDLQNQAITAAPSVSSTAAPYMTAANNATTAGTQQWNPTTASQYISPYAQAALQPQIQALQQQQAQNNLNIGAQATQAGAYGDAQHGVAQALNNFYAGQNLNNLEQTGMNQAYQQGLNQFNTANTNQLQAGQNYAGIGTEAQNAAATGNQNLFSMGTEQQQLNQTQLTEAYNNYLNQQNYPTQMLNLQMNALSNTPYSSASYQTLAPTNATAANIGSFASLAGAAGSLLNGSSGSGGSSGSSTSGVNSNVFGSDRRFKKNIKQIAKLASGIPIYMYQYIWSDKPYIGVMADEVEEIIPGAVITNELGYKFVDYGRLA